MDSNPAGAEANSGTTPVREGYAFDIDRLSAWMRDHVEGFSGPLSVEQFRGGQSNPTYKLVTPRKTYVMRRKPPGQLLPGAHAIDREARVLDLLGKQGFPVPRVHGLCLDDAIVGSWFFIMDHVEGRIFWDLTLPDVSREDRAAYFDAMNATLAQLHQYDPQAIGLGDYGKAGNYFARQISRWSRQYQEDELAGRDVAMDALIEWLPANIPPGEECSIVHGDFRCDNMIFHPERPQVIAVLDWELSTLGHPLSDLAYHAMMYRMPANIAAGLKGADLAALNIPDERQYVENYCRRTGRTGIAHWDFYMAFNLFRFAAIMHGIKGRVIRGTASSASAAERAASFPIIAALAHEAMDTSG